METLESSRVCRLCGKHSGISINIFDKNENHVKKINAVLPIMVHEMDLLPKHMCHRCSYKLEEFHKFYEDCLRTDTHLKSQLSWMRKGEVTERIGVPMVHIQNLKIKQEPLDFDSYDPELIIDNVNYLNPISFPVNGVKENRVSYATYPRCKCCCDNMDQSRRIASASYHKTVPASTPRNEEHDLGSPIEFQAVRQNLSERQSCTASWEEPLRDTGKRRPSTTNETPIDITKIKRDPQEDETPSNTRVLRPRRGSVDYLGWKRKRSTLVNLKKKSKSMDLKTSVQHPKLPEIKVEMIEDFKGRILRPRKTIDYNDTKRHNRARTKKQSVQHHETNPTESNVQCISGDLSSKVSKLFGVGGLRIKQEIADNGEGIIVNAHKRITNDLVSLPNSISLDVGNDRTDLNRSRVPLRNSVRIADKLKSLDRVAKKCAASSGKADLSHKTSNTYSSKFLRGQKVYFKNGKIRTVKEEPNSLQLMKNVKRTSQSKSTGLKHIDIKHFCEKCNVSLATKELYKLHACYV